MTANILAFPKMKPVPFIRVFPSGEYRLSEIERPAEIYMQACKFIAHGGRYLIAAMSAEEVQLVAAMMGAKGDVDLVEMDGAMVEVEREPVVIEVAACTAINGPELIDAVDRLIRASVERLDAAQDPEPGLRFGKPTVITATVAEAFGIKDDPDAVQ